MLKVGDTIQCRDKDDMLATYIDLQNNGAVTEFMYEKDGEKGLWLIVTEVEDE